MAPVTVLAILRPISARPGAQRRRRPGAGGRAARHSARRPGLGHRRCRRARPCSLVKHDGAQRRRRACRRSDQRAQPQRSCGARAAPIPAQASSSRSCRRALHGSQGADGAPAAGDRRRARHLDDRPGQQDRPAQPSTRDRSSKCARPSCRRDAPPEFMRPGVRLRDAEFVAGRAPVAQRTIRWGDIDAGIHTYVGRDGQSGAADERPDGRADDDHLRAQRPPASPSSATTNIGRACPTGRSCSARRADIKITEAPPPGALARSRN